MESRVVQAAADGETPGEGSSYLDTGGLDYTQAADGSASGGQAIFSTATYATSVAAWDDIGSLTDAYICDYLYLVTPPVPYSPTPLTGNGIIDTGIVYSPLTITVRVRGTAAGASCHAAVIAYTNVNMGNGNEPLTTFAGDGTDVTPFVGSGQFTFRQCDFAGGDGWHDFVFTLRKNWLNRPDWFGGDGNEPYQNLQVLLFKSSGTGSVVLDTVTFQWGSGTIHIHTHLPI